jgi:hypothetical protein
MQWVLFESHRTAKIFFENELDPREVADRLSGRIIEGKVIYATVDKKNDKAVWVNGLG